MEHWSVRAQWTFRDKDYTVSAELQEGLLSVQVEEGFSADQWRGSFEPKHIEELTRKTGNYKQFAVFLSMLESAVSKSSESVTLDLLTYSDLEALRNKKLGSVAHSPSKQLQAKRYLILTYTVEFDRIHYPLALPYAGKPDPAVLQETIRKLTSEVYKYKKLAQKKSSVSKLQQQYDAVLQDRDRLEQEFEAFRRQVEDGGDNSKEVRLLKRVVRNLERDLLQEKSKYQRYGNKKNEELKTLLQQMEELKSSERTLQVRVRSLTNELAILKRGSLRSSPLGGRRTHSKQRTSSCEKPIKHTQRRTPSPSGAGMPRFDPTAYIHRKQQYAKKRRGTFGKPPRSRSASAERTTLSTERPSRSSVCVSNFARQRKRSSSAGSCTSTHSRRSSDGTSNTKAKRKSRQVMKAAWSSPVHTAKHNDSSLLEHSAEISEIDARLTALQAFMKRSLETTKHFSKR